MNRSTKQLAAIVFTALSCSLQVTVSRAQAIDASAILTPKAGPEPRINGPKVFGLRPGHPLVFTIPASGQKPINFSVKNLPPGLKVDSKTGMLSGSISKAGTYTLLIE